MTSRKATYCDFLDLVQSLFVETKCDSQKGALIFFLVKAYLFARCRFCLVSTTVQLTGVLATCRLCQKICHVFQHTSALMWCVHLILSICSKAYPHVFIYFYQFVQKRIHSHGQAFFDRTMWLSICCRIAATLVLQNPGVVATLVLHDPCVGQRHHLGVAQEILELLLDCCNVGGAKSWCCNGQRHHLGAANEASKNVAPKKSSSTSRSTRRSTMQHQYVAAKKWHRSTADRSHQNDATSSRRKKTNGHKKMMQVLLKLNLLHI